VDKLCRRYARVVKWASARGVTCLPTQHSMIKSRVSFAHVTSLGSNSEEVEGYAGKGRPRNIHTADHFCNCCLG